MKNVIQSMCIAFAAILMTWSCSKSNSVVLPQEDEPVAVQFSSNIGGLTSNSSGIKPLAAGAAWGNNDSIGVFMVDHGTTNVRNGETNKRHVTADGSGDFAPDGTNNTIYYPVNGDKVDFISYYPYESSITTLGAYSVNVATQTTPGAIDLLYAKATNSSSGYDKTNTSPIALSFSHRLCKLTINTSVGASSPIPAGDLTTMTVSIAGMNTQAQFDLAAGTLGAASSKVAITPRTATAGAKYEAILLPGAFSGVSVTFVITAGTNAGTYVWNVSDDTFEAGKEYVYGITFTGGTISVTGTITDWTVVNQPGYDF